MIDYKRFYCCMGEGEQRVLNFMGDMLALPDPVVSKTSYDFVWSDSINAAGSPFYDWWLANWGLVVDDVTIFPGITLPAVIWSISPHLEFNLFRLTDDYTCPKGCRYTDGVFAVPGL